MNLESFEEAESRILQRLHSAESLSDVEFCFAYQPLDACRPLKKPTAVWGVQDAYAKPEGCGAKAALWLYVPQQQGGVALAPLFSRISEVLFKKENGVEAVSSGKVQYKSELYAFALPCTVSMTLLEKQEGDEAPDLVNIEVRGEAM